MGKKKSTQTNQVSWSTPPSTPQSTQLESMVGKSDFSVPIRNAFARAQQNLDRSYTNPLGSFTTADVRDKAKREQHMDLGQNLGQALGAAAQQNQQAAFGQQATVAGLTQPRMYQSGSTGTVSDPFGTALQIGSLATGGILGGLSGKGNKNGT